MQCEPMYLTTKEAATFLRLSTSTLAKARCQRAGPPYRLAGRRVLYRRDELIDWLDQNRIGATHAAPGSEPGRGSTT